VKLTRESVVWGAPAGLLGLLLAGFGAVDAFAPVGAFGPPLETLAVALGVALASLHRPLGGGVGLGLGTLLVLPALARVGVVPAALAVTAGALLAELGRRGLERRREAPQPERRRPVRVLAQVANAGLGTLAVGATWLALGQDGAGFSNQGLATTAALAAWVWLVPPTLFEVVARRLLREEGPGRILPALVPLVVDLPGFAAGALAVAVARRSDWTLASAWLAVAVALAFEAARQELAASANERRLVESQRLSRAGAALAAATPELERIALSILGECRAIVPFSWFQLELEVPELGRRSFRAGEGTELAEGAPEPPSHPPALPGIHRREPWQLLERSLEVEGERLGTLRLWCDPRRLEPRVVPLLDGLLPSMAASVRSALLDREARVDRLTGAATRRAFEPRLAAAFATCREEGRSLALLVVDLDHFKRINDTWGHPAGDRALVEVARVLVAPSRGRELCARWGGEEFVLLVEDVDGETGLEIAERLRRRVESLEVEWEGEAIALTISVGVVAFPELPVRAPEELLALADAALYAAKRLGRNLALLDLGRGRLRTGAGRVVELDESLTPPEAPVFFA